MRRGTRGYAEHADALIGPYESIGFADKHREALPFLPAVVLGDLLHRRLAPRRFQIGVCILLLTAGLSLTVHTAWFAR